MFRSVNNDPVWNYDASILVLSFESLFVLVYLDWQVSALEPSYAATIFIPGSGGVCPPQRLLADANGFWSAVCQEELLRTVDSASDMSEFMSNSIPA